VWVVEAFGVLEELGFIYDWTKDCENREDLEWFDLIVADLD